MSQSNLALLGGNRVYPSDWFGSKWPLAAGSELKEIQDVLNSYVWKGGSIGPKVKKFSREWANYCDAKYCIPVTNGTTALALSLIALDIVPGDEIIVPAWSCAAVVQAIHSVGGVPVFCDIEPLHLTLDPSAVEKAISPKTKVILAVHFGGQPANLDALCALSAKYQVHLVEDAASSHGVVWNEQKVGSIGDIGVFSFGQGKNMTCGQGGAIVTNSRDFFEQILSVSEFGQLPGAGDTGNFHFRVGGNHRMSEFHAAILIAQFSQLDYYNEVRAQNAERLIALLKDIPGITPIDIDTRVTKHTWNLLLFRIDSHFFSGIDKELFCRATTAEGIFISSLHTRPLYEEPMYDLEAKVVKGTGDAIRVTACPETEKASEEICAIHHSLLMADPIVVHLVAKAIEKVQMFSDELVPVAH